MYIHIYYACHYDIQATRLVGHGLIFGEDERSEIPEDRIVPDVYTYVHT